VPVGVGASVAALHEEEVEVLVQAVAHQNAPGQQASHLLLHYHKLS